MRRIAIALLSGLAALLLLGCAYAAARWLGVKIDANVIALAVAALAFASTTAVFTLLALHGMADRSPVYASTPLNKDPVKRFIAMFADSDTLQIIPRPEPTVGPFMARYGDMLNDPEKQAGKKIVLIVRASRKGMFNPVILKEIFQALKPFKCFYHVLLLGSAGDYVGYIPAESALKDFTGDNAETKIRKCIVDVLEDPAKSTVLRTMKGAAREDVIADTADIRDAARKIWMDEENKELRRDDSVQGLVVCKHLKPIGFLDKLSVLTLTSTGA